MKIWVCASIYNYIYIYVYEKGKIKSDITLAEKRMPQLASRVVYLAPLD